MAIRVIAPHAVTPVRAPNYDLVTAFGRVGAGYSRVSSELQGT